MYILCSQAMTQNLAILVVKEILHDYFAHAHLSQNLHEVHHTRELEKISHPPNALIAPFTQPQ